MGVGRRAGRGRGGRGGEEEEERRRGKMELLERGVKGQVYS